MNYTPEISVFSPLTAKGTRGEPSAGNIQVVPLGTDESHFHTVTVYYCNHLIFLYIPHYIRLASISLLQFLMVLVTRHLAGLYTEF